MCLCQGHKSYLDYYSLYLSTSAKKTKQYTVKIGSALMVYLLLHFLYASSRDIVLDDETYCST